MTEKNGYRLHSPVSARPPIRRAFEVSFTRVTEESGLFCFYIKENLVCEIEKEWFDPKQRLFFESISDPNGDLE